MSLFNKASSPQDDAHNNSEASCPNCGSILDKAPTRKTTCPHCKITIYVRTKQNLYPSPYLTTDQVEIVDALKDIEWRGITTEVFLQEKAILSREFQAKGYRGASDSDTLWRIYAKLNDRYAREGDFDSLSWIYGAMAGHLTRHGKNSFNLQRESKRYSLYSIKKACTVSLTSSVKSPAVYISVADIECAACKSLSNKEYGVDEAIKTMPLPCKDCTFKVDKEDSPFCICYYVLKV